MIVLLIDFKHRPRILTCTVILQHIMNNTANKQGLVFDASSQALGVLIPVLAAAAQPGADARVGNMEHCRPRCPSPNKHHRSGLSDTVNEFSLRGGAVSDRIIVNVMVEKSIRFFSHYPMVLF